MRRRDFVAGAGAFAATVASGNALGAAAPNPLRSRRLSRIGLELYSVRGPMAKDPERTLAAVAKMGYHDVELLWSFGNFGRSVAQVRAALDANGLRAPSAHVSPAVILVGWERSLEAAHRLGMEYIIVPSLTVDTQRSLDDWREWADRFNDAGGQARRAGLWLAFHNEPDHMRPLEGQVPYDVFVARTDPAAVRLQLDVGNMTLGGADPMRYLAEYRDRYWSFHLKAVVADGSRDTELGAGKVDLRGILAGVPDLDRKPCFVEQEGPADPMASAAANLAWLKALEF